MSNYSTVRKELKKQLKIVQEDYDSGKLKGRAKNGGYHVCKNIKMAISILSKVDKINKAKDDLK